MGNSNSSVENDYLEQIKKIDKTKRPEQMFYSSRA